MRSPSCAIIGRVVDAGGSFYADADSPELVGRYFAGRATELATVIDALSAAQPLVLSITGDRGVGKSALIRAAADIVGREGGTKVAFCSGTTPPWSDIFDDASMTVYANAQHWLIDTLTRTKATVLVVDDADAARRDLYRPFLEIASQTQVRQLVTVSCSPLDLGLSASGLELLPMSDLELEAMLRRRLELTGSPPPTSAVPIAMLSDGNPRKALALAAEHWRGTPLDVAYAKVRALEAASLRLRDGTGAREGTSANQVDGPSGQLQLTDAAQDASDTALVEAELRIAQVGSSLSELVARDPERIYRLDPEQFEVLVADLYSRNGFEVEMTPRSGDEGVDLYAVKFLPFGRLLTVVDCKRYTPPHRVGVGVVRTLFGTVNDHDASMGVLVTSSFFTRGAHELQRKHRHRLGLQDFNALARMLHETYVRDDRPRGLA